MNMSVEEITHLLEKNKCSYTVELDLCEKVDGEEIQAGEFPPNDTEHIEEEIKSVLRRAEVFAKQAGTYPAGLERAVGEVFEQKPPWPILLGLEIKRGIKEDASFAYQSRRGDSYPGPISYDRNINVLVDTSGSIDEETLKKFLGIVAYEARNATVNVIAWDAEAYEPIKARTPSEVAKVVAKKMKGGGGTVIAPALRKALATMEYGSTIIILTDGDIDDKNSKEVSDLCIRLSRKASAAVIGYTLNKFSPPGFKSFMIW
jgi:predicted metal-dependent peptidase